MVYSLATIFGASTVLFISVSCVLRHFPSIIHKKKHSVALPCIAHRGGGGEQVENSMRAFHHAVQNCKVDMLELDVHLTKDGEVVVFHDFSFDRVVGQSGYISEVNYADLPRLPNNERIPKLEEVFEAFPNTWINVEAKQPNPVIVPKMHELITRYNRKDRTIWGAGIESTAKIMHAHDASIPMFFSAKRMLLLYLWHYTFLLPFIPLRETYLEFPLLKFTPQLFQHARMSWFNTERKRRWFLWVLNTTFCRPSLFRHLRRRGIRTFAWTLNSVESFEYAFDHDIEGVMTDYPTMLREFVDKRAAEKGGKQAKTAAQEL